MNNEPSGILAYVLRSCLGDRTNGGITAKADRVLLVLPNGGPFTASELNIPAVYVKERKELSKALNRDCTIVIPYGEKEGDFCMGGNFLWTCDSRFPSDRPIPIHDRPLVNEHFTNHN